MTAAERAGLTTLLHREGAFRIPAGARSIIFKVLATESSASGNQTSSALIDNISAQLTLDTPTITLGLPYCSPAQLNSTGASGKMAATGSPFPEDNAVTLTASSLPVNAFGFFITSMAQGFVVGPGGSDGDLCLGGDIGRYVGAGQIQSSDAAGTFSLSIDVTVIPTPTGFTSASAGQTWNFQAWHRDSEPMMATSNFTEGLALTFE